jgi:acyl carrier protein
MQPKTTLSNQTATSDKQIMEEVKQIVAESCGISMDQIDESKTRLVDLPWDSLDQVECVMELEEQFNISISDEMMANAKTVGDIANGIATLLSQTRETEEPETTRS